MSLSPDELAAIDDILGDESDPAPESLPVDQLDCELGPLSIPSPTKSHSKSSLNRSANSAMRHSPSIPSLKCAVACIGGPDLPSGRTSDVTTPHFCSNLICVSCDHKVIRFPNYKWSPNTDYLFLRNNYPDTVEQNLIPAPGRCAYCCQCTFCDETDVKHLNSFNSTWACRGHQ